MVRRKKRARKSPAAGPPVLPGPLRNSLREPLTEHLAERRSRNPVKAASKPAEAEPQRPDVPRIAPAPRTEIPPPPPSEPNLLERLFQDVQPLRGPARIATTPALNPIPNTSMVVERAARAVPRFVLERGYDEAWGYRADLGPHALDELWRYRWLPQQKIDLHGHTMRTLVPLLTAEVRALQRRGVRRLLLIHGKGRHSQGGVGVLADAVVEVLTEGALAAHVKAFRTAPAHLGGRGALAVELDVGGVTT